MHTTAENLLIPIGELAEMIKKTNGIEGITLLGGEPLEQSESLLHLVRSLKESNLTVMLYTGYEKEQIVSTEWNELIALSDIVVFGRYRSEMRSINLLWRGSTNQEIIFNNDEYLNEFNRMTDINQIEIHITENGEFILTGYPDDKITEEVFK